MLFAAHLGAPAGALIALALATVAVPLFGPEMRAPRR